MASKDFYLRQLAMDKKYHYSVYYNHYEGPSDMRDEDHKLSSKVLERLVTTLREIGFDKVHHEGKFLPGANLFEQNLVHMVKDAEKVVVILTKGYVENHWHMFKEQTSHMSLIKEKNSKNFLPVSVGYSRKTLPDKLGLTISNVVFFNNNWCEDEHSWEKIRAFFLEKKPVSELHRSVSHVPVQAQPSFSSGMSELQVDSGDLAVDGAPTSFCAQDIETKPPQSVHGGTSDLLAVSGDYKAGRALKSYSTKDTFQSLPESAVVQLEKQFQSMGRKQEENSGSSNADELQEDQSKSDTPEKTLTEILMELKGIMQQDLSKNLINVTRDDVLDGAKRGFRRKIFQNNRLLDVRFSGELGIDNGGPSMEFMTLTLKAIRDSSIFCGDDQKKMIIQDIAAEKRGEYKEYGQMLAYFICLNGPAPKFFSELLFQLIAYGFESTKIQIEDVMDMDDRTAVQKVQSLNTTDEFFEHLTSIMDYSGAFDLTEPTKKQELIDKLCHFLVVKRLGNCIEQFKCGLRCNGVLDAVQQYPDRMKSLFVNSHQKLDATMLDELFEVMFSVEGSNKYKRELKTQAHWRDLLQDLEEERSGLAKLLTFVTGMDNIPGLGFDPHLKLQFSHPTEEHDLKSGVPFANTCINTLTIPVLSTYETFKQRMLLALELGQQFTNH